MHHSYTLNLLILIGCSEEKLKLGMSDDDVTVLPWLSSNIFLVVSMI